MENMIIWLIAVVAIVYIYNKLKRKTKYSTNIKENTETSFTEYETLFDGVTCDGGDE